VVLISASGRVADAARVPDVAAYVAKPFSLDDLTDAIHRALGAVPVE